MIIILFSCKQTELFLLKEKLSTIVQTVLAEILIFVTIMEAYSPKTVSTNSPSSKLPNKKNSPSLKPSTASTPMSTTKEDRINLCTTSVMDQAGTIMLGLPKEEIATLIVGGIKLNISSGIL